MNQKELKHFHELLLQEKKKITKELDELENKIDKPSNSSAYPWHMADIGTETADREEESIVITSLTKRILLIDEALENIQSKKYGKCEKCGKLIDKKRLNAKPYAKLCIKCREIEEKMQYKR